MKLMNQKQIPTNQNQIPNNMKPMKQKLIPSCKISSLAVLLLLPMSGQAASTSVINWSGLPLGLVAGDKIYKFDMATPNFISSASVEATEDLGGGYHYFELSGLVAMNSVGILRYTVEITDPTNFFWFDQVSEVAANGNNVAGSVTTVFSDPWITPVHAPSILQGTDDSPSLATGTGLQKIWVETVTTDIGANRLSSMVYTLTQTSAIPEVTSSFSLLAMLSSGLLLRRRTKS